MGTESILGVEIDIEKALILLNDKKIKQNNNSVFHIVINTLNFDNEHFLNVTVDHDGEFGYICLFNETYNFNTFSFEHNFLQTKIC